jgi:hypothetical protein
MNFMMSFAVHNVSKTDACQFLILLQNKRQNQERIGLLENFAVNIHWLLLQFHFFCSLLHLEVKTISARISNTNTVSFQINSNKQLCNRSNKNRTLRNYPNFLEYIFI